MEIKNPLSKFVSRRTHAVGEYVIKACSFAFEDDLESIELLRTMEDGEYFIAFELYFQKELEDGLDNIKIDTFVKIFNLPNSNCSFDDYTIYAKDNQICIAFTVIPKSDYWGGMATEEWKECYAK